MFEKNLRVAYLLDIYADALDEHVRSVMRAYYEDDLSLSEIAADVGISRQGIRHLIKKGEETIEFLESKLGLSSLYANLSEISISLSKVYEKINKIDGLKDESNAVKSAIEIISKGNQDVSESD